MEQATVASGSFLHFLKLWVLQSSMSITVGFSAGDSCSLFVLRGLQSVLEMMTAGYSRVFVAPPWQATCHWFNLQFERVCCASDLGHDVSITHLWPFLVASWCQPPTCPAAHHPGAPARRDAALPEPRPAHLPRFPGNTEPAVGRRMKQTKSATFPGSHTQMLVASLRHGIQLTHRRL